MKVQIALLSLVMLVSTPSVAISQSVRELRETVVAELQPFCNTGSQITVGDDAMSFAANGIATVRLAAFQCQWEFINHPFCGARYCTVRDYTYQNGRFVIVEERLQ